jgi:hypothetical protein
MLRSERAGSRGSRKQKSRTTTTSTTTTTRTSTRSGKNKNKSPGGSRTTVLQPDRTLLEFDVITGERVSSRQPILRDGRAVVDWPEGQGATLDETEGFINPADLPSFNEPYGKPRRRVSELEAKLARRRRLEDSPAVQSRSGTVPPPVLSPPPAPQPVLQPSGGLQHGLSTQSVNRLAMEHWDPDNAVDWVVDMPVET